MTVGQIREVAVEVVRFALKIIPTIRPDRLGVGYERERRVKDGSKILGLSNWKDRIASRLCGGSHR